MVLFDPLVCMTSHVQPRTSRSLNLFSRRETCIHGPPPPRCLIWSPRFACCIHKRTASRYGFAYVPILPSLRRNGAYYSFHSCFVCYRFPCRRASVGASSIVSSHKMFFLFLFSAAEEGRIYICCVLKMCAVGAFCPAWVVGCGALWSLSWVQTARGSFSGRCRFCLVCVCRPPFAHHVRSS